jgi:hypothetical protein
MKATLCSELPKCWALYLGCISHPRKLMFSIPLLHTEAQRFNDLPKVTHHTVDKVMELKMGPFDLSLCP